MTGSGPLRHGICYDWPWDPDGMRVAHLTTNHLTPFWKTLALEGYAVGVLDVPYAPIAGMPNGIEISEWGSHDWLLGRLTVSPASRTDWVRARGGVHPFAAGPVDASGPRDARGLRRLAAACLAGVRARGTLAVRLLAEMELDLLLVVFPEIHKSSHLLWHTVDPAQSPGLPALRPGNHRVPPHGRGPHESRRDPCRSTKGDHHPQRSRSRSGRRRIRDRARRAVEDVRAAGGLPGGSTRGKEAAMRTHALAFAAALLVNSAQAQPTATPLKVNPLPQVHTDLVVRAVAARDLPPRVTSTARPGLDEVVRLLRANQMAEARGQWSRMVSAAGLGSEADVNALVQWVLRQAYLETNKDLKSYADKVRYYNEIKQEIRDDLGRARSGRAVKGIALVPYRPDGAAVKTEPPRVVSKAERDQYIKSLEDKLYSIGDDAQLANVDLQNALQKQQQTLQMMSNVSKMLHDTAMAVIRKIGS
jgi:hypothetical protein